MPSNTFVISDKLLIFIHGLNDYNVLKRFGARFYASKNYGDTIYQVTTDEIFPRYWIDMTAVDGTANFGKDMSNEKVAQIMDSKPTFVGNLYVESDDYDLFSVSKMDTVPKSVSEIEE